MPDLFDSYEEEFNELRAQVEQRSRTIPTLEGASKRTELQRAETELREMDQIIRKMNLSGRSNAKMVPKIKEYEQEMSRLRNAIRKADMQVSQATDRGELFSGVKLDDVMSGSMSQRERLISANDRLDKGSADIEYANRLAEETVRDGVVILENLDTQSEQMRRMRLELEDIDTTLGKARKVMTSIARRAWANKIILAVIALLMVAGIGLIIYFRFVRDDSASTGAATTTGSTTGILPESTTGQYTTGQYTTGTITSGSTSTTSSGQ